MKNVTLENFDQDVITASMTVPVLVDFWATWCGPCKTIGPILEKLEVDYKGRFNLVKIDSDQEQELAQAFGIRSIPTCILLMNGKPVDGFQGAMPESQVRAFLDKHLPPAAPEPEEGLPPPEVALSPAEQLEKLRSAVAADPSNDKIRTSYLKALLLAGDWVTAQQVFAPVTTKTSTSMALDAVQRWIDALVFAHATADVATALQSADAAISANKRDFDARFNRARLLLAQQRVTDAMDELLEILMRDKVWQDGLARKTYLAVLEVIEPPAVTVEPGKIPPQDPTVSAYRRRLSSVILS